MAYTIVLHFKFRSPQEVTFRGGLEAAIAIATDYLRIHKADEVQVLDGTNTIVFSRSPPPKGSTNT